jgi:Gpi18-like mannosyltransferase
VILGKEDPMKKLFHYLRWPGLYRRGTLLLIWLGWALIMLGYQAYVLGRFNLQIADRSLSWTESEVRPNYQAGRPYLLEPFLNDHVAWDSEYYLSIAVGGYQDPVMRAIPQDYTWSDPQVMPQAAQPGWVSMNHAFFPFYPWMMHALAVPLAGFGLNKIATAALAGVLVSLLGTLGAMFALHDMARDSEGEAGGIRAAFYLLIFPAAMFLAQVYTEGLFLGLSFGALALARRKRWIWAALLAACATWTRAAGALLALPMGLFWLKEGGFRRLFSTGWWKEAGRIILIASPVWAYLAFNALLGRPFHIVETSFFGRGLLLIDRSWLAWKDAFARMLSSNLQGRTYFMVEFAAIAFGLLACIWMFKRESALSVYSLCTILFSLTSGGAQGMHRYVMAAPVIFLLAARWGKREAFDRVWTLVNVLLLGVFAILFSFDLWAG